MKLYIVINASKIRDMKIFQYRTEAEECIVRDVTWAYRGRIAPPKELIFKHINEAGFFWFQEHENECPSAVYLIEKEIR